MGTGCGGGGSRGRGVEISSQIRGQVPPYTRCMHATAVAPFIVGRKNSNSLINTRADNSSYSTRRREDKPRVACCGRVG